MAILTLKVKGQTLTVESEIDRIVENSVNYLDFKIICDDENWEDLAKKVVVTYDKKAWEAFTIIPSETIHSPGFTISVIGSRKPGTNGDDDLGEIVTTYPVAVKVFPSGATNGSDPEDTVIDFSTADELNAKIEYWTKEFSDNLNKVEFELEQEIIELKKEVDEKNELQDINIENVFSNIGKKTEGKDSITNLIKRLNIQASGTNYIGVISWRIATSNDIDELINYAPEETITNIAIFKNSDPFNIRLNFLSYNGIKFRIALYREDKTLIKYTNWVTKYSFTEHENDTDMPAYFKLLATNDDKEINDIEYITSSIIIYHRNQGLQATIENTYSEIQEIKNNKSVDLEADRKNKEKYPNVADILEYIDKKDAKEITEPCHIADLDEGVYLVKGDISGNNGKVVVENISPESGIVKDYCYIIEGTLRILRKEITSEGDIEEGLILYSATGQIVSQNHTFTDETQDDEGNIITFESVTAVEHLTTINAGIVRVAKTKESTEDEGKQYEADTWYSFSQYTSSDIAATAIDEQIPENPTNFKIPSSLAVKNYVKAYVDEQLGVIENGSY